MNKLICLDTQIVIWGIKRQCKEGQEIMIKRAELFLDELEKKDLQVLIPAIVISELLAPLPVEQHESFLYSLNKNFMIAPFDIKTARVNSEIFRRNFDKELLKSLEPPDHNPTRNHLKIDCMIVATACANNAVCLYSNDGHIKHYSDGFIKTSYLPDAPSQLSLL